MLKWTKPGQFVLSVTFQERDTGRPAGLQLFQGNKWITRCQKLCHFCFLLLGKEVTTWCWATAAWEGTVPFSSWERRGKTHTSQQALCRLLLFLKWKAWLKPGLEQGSALKRCRRRSRRQRWRFVVLSLINFEDLSSRKELNRHDSKFWPHQILAVWALPGLSGDNSTIFMFLIQGYKYRLVLFSILSKHGGIDKAFTVKDGILSSIPLDLLQWLLLNFHLSLIQMNSPIYQLLL